jgi:hypothetical protein
MSNKPSALMLRQETSPEAKESMTAIFANAEPFRDKAVEMLKAKKRAIEVRQRKQKNYELPAWSEMQADCNGSIRTIEEILREVFNIGGVKDGK